MNLLFTFRTTYFFLFVSSRNISTAQASLLFLSEVQWTCAIEHHPIRKQIRRKRHYQVFEKPNTFKKYSHFATTIGKLIYRKYTGAFPRNSICGYVTTLSGII